MKVRVDIELDTETGAYDVRIFNISAPNSQVDIGLLTELTHRVLDSVAIKAESDESALEPQTLVSALN